MRVIETVRASQCPRCGKPATRCRCDLKKSIRQRTKCVFSYILPKVTETYYHNSQEKLSSNEANSPQSFKLVTQNQLQETTTDDDTMLAENYISCPRCIMKLKRFRESQEVDSNTVCQHCMLRAQICKLKAEKRNSRLRSQHTKRTTKKDKLEIIFMTKKNLIALTESKPSCEEQDVLKQTTPKETEMKLSDKLHKYKYSPTELNILRAKSVPTDLTETQNMSQLDTIFLTYKEDNIQIKPTDIEKNIKFKPLFAKAKAIKASACPSACTISNLRELKYKLHPEYSRPQLSDICKSAHDTQTSKEKIKKPAAVLRDSQELMTYRFPTVPKKDIVQKRVISSVLIRRTRKELLDKEEKKQKEREKILARKLEKEKRIKEREDFNMKQQEQQEKLEVKKEELSELSNQKDHEKIEEISTKKHKEDDRVNQKKRQKEMGIPSQKRNLEEENMASKQKKDKEEAEKRNKKEEEDVEKKKKKEKEDVEKKKKKEEEDVEKKKKKEEEMAEKKRREEIEALKKQKAEEDRLKKEQQKVSNKKEEGEATKKEKEASQVAKRKIEEETEGFKKNKDDEASKKSDDKKKKEKEELEKKHGEDKKRSRDKSLFQTDSELIIYKLIKEHKDKRAEERILLAQQSIIADRQKLAEMAKKKQEADKNKLEDGETRTISNKQTAANRYMTSDEAKALKQKKLNITDIIIGDNIYQSKLPLPPDPLLQELPEPTPLLFKKKITFSDVFDTFPDDKAKHVEGKRKDALTSDNKAKDRKSTASPDREPTDGVFRYALSDRTFIDKGWTVLPVEEVVRKMNVYRMHPAQPEFDWFERNKKKGFLEYDTGEKLAVFDDHGGCRWYYKNGRLALDYYNSEELNSQHRFVVYSNGEPDERGRSRPYTVLATFSHLGTGVVFDHSGKIRLKYNQTEGVLLDREIGPVTTWKWHSLNDPPVLRQVMINSKLSHKDQTILQLGAKDDSNIRKKDDMMSAIESENAIKEMQKKQSLDFKPFQIKTKVLKINENFSLKVLDQATIYLIFREGSVNIKLNIGMLLDHHEIVDTDTAALGVVSTCVERFPAATDSIAALQRSVERAQRFERNRTERERILRPAPPGDSAEHLAAALSRPLKVPLRTLSTSQIASGHCRCSRKPPCNLYYNSRLA